MSVPGEKVRDSSDAPRIERERSLSSPGTMLTACSMGRVTANICWRALRDVPCATMVMRENCSCG